MHNRRREEENRGRGREKALKAGEAEEREGSLCAEKGR